MIDLKFYSKVAKVAKNTYEVWIATGKETFSNAPRTGVVFRSLRLLACKILGDNFFKTQELKPGVLCGTTDGLYSLPVKINRQFSAA